MQPLLTVCCFSVLPFCVFLDHILTTCATRVQFAIENAINYDKCHPKKGDEKLACLLDKATVNIGTLFSKQVEGRVSTEVSIMLIATKLQMHALSILRSLRFLPQMLSCGMTLKQECSDARHMQRTSSKKLCCAGGPPLGL